MTATDRFLTAVFLAAAPAARLLEVKHILDADGLPAGGVPYFALLVLACAAVFLLRARALPGREGVTADFARLFRFDSQLVLSAAVMGSFLLFASAALRLVRGGMETLPLLLSALSVLSGGALLYAVVALRRGGGFEPIALLVPACDLVVRLVVTYRMNAQDSVLLHFYGEILAVAALCLAALYLAAFAFRNGSPRAFSVVSHAAMTLCAGCCADLACAGRLDDLALCLGAVFLLAAFLEAAGDFET